MQNETKIDLSVVIPTRNEAGNISQAVSEVREVCDGIGMSHEIIVVDGDSTDGTAEIAGKAGANVIGQLRPGYGGALHAGFEQARGEYILTLDADLSHPPVFIERLWDKRQDGDLLIASRYVPAGYARMPWTRYLLSSVLNQIFSKVLSIPVKDMSSGFRLYRREALEAIDIEGTNFSVLQNILVSLYCHGYQVLEVPFYYRPRASGVSNARIIPFGISYIRALFLLWKLRNSISSADYDFRAFYSRHPLQRYWQRKRYRIITDFIDGSGEILDVGCGSGVFAAQYPRVTALDIRKRKLRFLSQYNSNCIQGDAANLPFDDESFHTVVCSEVIEHTLETQIIPECLRVLKPGGTLILGTPDYGSWQWPTIEKVYQIVQPGGYADEHINPYTRKRLIQELKDLGLSIVGEESILSAELIIKAVKNAKN